ncbi:serine hydrolase [Streptomyces sp. NPDC060064]|uniref:serine hydrolase n=1 Tax=Streptomyces sp. NPDC060064 TaxID=3347049 RepID=UPI00369ED9FD
MTHGGGTVAGESPDKSEQRKSSGETTSGERDPRLAVFRQASPGAAAPGADQPTAVFKMPPEPSAPANTERGTESGSAENDARLRAAVAAWVASADDEGASADAEAPSEAAEAPVPAPGSGDASEGLSGEQAGSGAAAEREPAAADEAESPAEDEGQDEAALSGSSGQDGEAGSGASAEPERAGAEGSASEADDDAAEADADAEVEARDEDTSVSESEPADEAAASVPSGQDDGEASEDEPGSSTSTEPEPAGAEDSGAEGSASDAAKPASQAAPSDEAAASAPSGQGDAETSDDETGSDATAEPEPAGSEGAGSEGSGSEAAKSEAVPAPAGEVEVPSGTDTGTGGAAEPAPAKGAGSAEAKGATPADQAAPAAPKRTVDQPTAVFKTPRRPVVDQPTTALKVPPAARPKPKPKPEADVPRSSTFVPLRADDVRDPAAAKPQAAAPAATNPASTTPAAPAALTEAERTRQQPMPPLPPLDLLAELTNTPPPPQTPVRTVVRRVKIWTPLVLLLLIVFAVVQAVRPLPEPSLALSAEPTFTFKGGPLSLPFPDEGQGAVEVEGVGSIGTYGAQKPAPLASVAKTMTAYVILRDHPLKGEEVGPKITVDQQAADESNNHDESRANFSKGQQFTEKQMLQLLMIPSSNNAARLLARWDAKTEAEFVKKMNDAAKDLGMTNSTYTDPSGLKATTVSTPQDQLKLAKAVMQNDVFRGIVDTTLTTVPGIDGTIRNNNDKALLEEGVGGIKTGSSTPAGGNLLWSANVEVDGKVRRIVGVAMGAQKATILDDKLNLAIDYSIAMIKAAQKGVTSATVVKKGDVVGYVDNGLGGRTAVVATKELKAVGWGGLKVQIAISDSGKALPHSAKAGDVVGQVSVGSGTGKVTAPVALQQDLVEPGLGDKLTRLG